MRKFDMFITAVCVLFLVKLRWPKNKSLYDTWQLVFLCFFFVLFFSSESEFVFQAHSTCTVNPQIRICQFGTLTGYSKNVA